MAKIKDLVDVVLDNALLLFPVDSERYELADAVQLLATSGMKYLGLYEHANWRVNEWLTATDAIVRDYSEVFSRSVFNVYPLTKLELDKVRRIRALNLPLDPCNEEDFDWLHDSTYGALWRCILFRMNHSEHFQVDRPSTGRKST